MGVQVPPRTLFLRFPGGSVLGRCVALARRGPCNCQSLDRRIRWPKLPAELGPTEIYRACDVSALDFKTTADLPDLTEIIGQDRAVSSVEFGMGIDSDGYNIFAVGPTGTGKIDHRLRLPRRDRLPRCPAPDDWVYVYNFAKPYEPNAIRMPAGKAQDFRKDMEKLVEDLQAAITQAFEGEEYEKQKRAIAQQVGEKQEAKLSGLNEKAEAQSFTMVRTPAGLAFAPKTAEGETMSREAYEALPPGGAEAHRRRPWRL